MNVDEKEVIVDLVPCACTPRWIGCRAVREHRTMVSKINIIENTGIVASIFGNTINCEIFPCDTTCICNAKDEPTEYCGTYLHGVEYPIITNNGKSGSSDVIIKIVGKVDYLARS